jgi:hypothetical protein
LLSERSRNPKTAGDIDAVYAYGLLRDVGIPCSLSGASDQLKRWRRRNTAGPTRRTWVLVTIGDATKELMKTYVQYPPRKLQSEAYSGPITLSQYEHLQYLRDSLAKEGIKIPLPTGN